MDARPAAELADVLLLNLETLMWFNVQRSKRSVRSCLK